MRVSNRRKDLAASKRMEQVMSAVYAKFGWQELRPCNSELDKRGIDIVLQTGQETIWADEKAATSYWNRDLKTYSCELSCERTKGGYGWFAKKSNSYMLNTVPFPVSWTVKMKKKQKETQDILSYHTQAAGCSDKARAKASGGRQPIEECGRTGL